MLYNTNDSKKIKAWMLFNRHTLVVAERVTSGHLQADFSTANNASQFFQDGITVYNVHQKYTHFHVDPAHDLYCNCVSRQIAEEMAENVCTLFGADWGIGITGYAAPLQQEPDKQLYALYSIAFRGKRMKTDAIIAWACDSFDVEVGYLNTVLKNCMSVFMQQEHKMEKKMGRA